MRKLTHSFELHSKERGCRKKVRLGLEQVKGDQEPIAKRTRPCIYSTNHMTIQTIQPLNEPISAIKTSSIASQKYTTPSHSRALEAQLLTHVANSVLYHETGKQLNYGQLRKNPKIQETWNKYFSNEMVRLCQGVGTG